MTVTVIIDRVAKAIDHAKLIDSSGDEVDFVLAAERVLAAELDGYQVIDIEQLQALADELYADGPSDTRQIAEWLIERLIP